MISRLQMHVPIAFTAVLMVATVSASSAQKIKLPLIDMDCSAYRRQDDGTWIVLYLNNVVLGSNVNKAVLPGDDPRSVELTPSSTLDGVLNAICAKFNK